MGISGYCVSKGGFIMLEQKLLLQEQECEGNYDFTCQSLCTKGFMSKFESIISELADETLRLINETYEKPDRLQVLFYGRTKFWVLANYEKECERCGYKKEADRYVIFMLPEEY